MNSYPRESVEFQAVTVVVAGATVTDGVTLCDIPDGQRPETFVAPVILDGRTGVMVGGYQPGMRRIWAKVAGNPETPVIDCGEYRIT